MFITSFYRQNFLFVFAVTDKSQAMIQKKLWGSKMTKQDLDFYENHKKVNPIGYYSSRVDLTIFSRLKIVIQILFVFRILYSNKRIVCKPD